MDKPKLVGIEFTPDGRIGSQVAVDLDKIGEYIEIPLYKDKGKEPVNPDDVIRARMEEVWEK